MFVDKIYVLKNGKIIEKGNHKSLLKFDGYYKKLYTEKMKSILL